MSSPDRLIRGSSAQTKEESESESDEDEPVAADADVFVYIVRVPFHPQRLARTLREHFDELRFDGGDDGNGGLRRESSTGIKANGDIFNKRAPS